MNYLWVKWKGYQNLNLNVINEHICQGLYAVRREI
uniref:Uncharacterized protein n=1 Tax=Rhizophora mucronata TaxID=61149 RepID=A0A2P2PIT1_RHIMU